VAVVVAAGFVEAIAIAATVAGVAVLVYLLWLILEEHAVKRYMRQRSELARFILEKPRVEEPIFEEEAAEEQVMQPSALGQRRFAHS
jgi:hypothetical protein